ncbi:MAG TPA: transcription termination factor NusA [Acidimicrobiia bacterium]|nr:transcription termination factor NusA [Acidimicrobiia bacterium]
MNDSFMEELDHLEREKGVPKETILEALANALVSAYKRSPGAAEEARVTIDQDTGEITVYGQELDEDGNVTREWPDTPSDFGRIGAQTAKQVILQRLREAKRAQVYEVYEGREGSLVTGIVQQSDHRTVLLDLGNAEAVMPAGERIPYERLDRGARVKALIIEVREEAKGSPIVVSRSSPDFIRRLFELEVPELVEGTIEIKAIAREAGHRTKIAVFSNDQNVDPVGACVGSRGSRVRQVVNELRGEKVDIVEWREDTKQFIAEALSPARVRQVILEEDEEGNPVARVIVPDFQLSLAIGKEGQNARLAAKLSGYKVDIKSETEHAGGTLEDGAEPGETAAPAASTATEAPEGDAAPADAEAEEASTEEAASGDESAPEAEDQAEAQDEEGPDTEESAPEAGEEPEAPVESEEIAVPEELAIEDVAADEAAPRDTDDAEPTPGP